VENQEEFDFLHDTVEYASTVGTGGGGGSSSSTAGSKAKSQKRKRPGVSAAPPPGKGSKHQKTGSVVAQANGSSSCVSSALRSLIAEGVTFDNEDERQPTVAKVFFPPPRCPSCPSFLRDDLSFLPFFLCDDPSFIAL
jgi:hypothetical protein